MLSRTLKISCNILMVAFVVLSTPDAFAKKGGNPEKYDTTGKTFKPGDNKFCWRNKYTTGKATDQKCSSGYENVGMKCRKKCPTGMKRDGLKCKTKCPGGLRNSGPLSGLCEIVILDNLSDYNNKETFKKKDKNKCIKKHGTCVKNGAGKYVKTCKVGYKAVAKKCKVDNGYVKAKTKSTCKKYGMKSVAGGSCKKKVAASPVKRGTCKSGNEKSLGKCYKPCNKGDKRLGNICTTAAPDDWVKCGLGSSKNKNACAAIVFNQASSVAMLAVNIATMGGAEAADKAVDSGKLKKTFSDLSKGWDVLKTSNKVKLAIGTYKKANKTYKAVSAANTAKNAQTAEDYVRMSAQILSIIDISGVSDVVGAFTYPTCLKYYE